MCKSTISLRLFGEFGFLVLVSRSPEPAQANVVVYADKLPAEHSAWVDDVKLHRTRPPAANHNSLHESLHHVKISLYSYSI